MLNDGKPRRRLDEDYSTLVASPAIEEATPVREEIDSAELSKLREARRALALVSSMARKAFNRGDLDNSGDVPSIALAAKILHVADPALKQ